ncbi:MAG TPA: DUF1345 domain-containing protein [Candidatus Nitrosotalea sp.]|nr:DUF1345 domain-containing protein [Candidatus Nitrosotalea sp.]
MKARAFAPIAASVAAAAAAGAGMFFAPDWLSPMARIVACYDVGALTLLLWQWRIVLKSDVHSTKTRAAAQDPGRDAVFVLTLVAVVFGFAAAFAILGRGPHDRVGGHTAILYVLGFGAVLLGWLQIHTDFSLRYAHLYYRDRDTSKAIDRGLAFPGGDEPSYIDFAYFSFVIGMTFQVSDVQITGRPIRKLVLMHGLISFGYNTAILALVVNIVSGLLH